MGAGASIGKKTVEDVQRKGFEIAAAVVIAVATETLPTSQTDMIKRLTGAYLRPQHLTICGNSANHTPFCFGVSLLSSQGFLLTNELHSSFILRISYESLDFLQQSNGRPLVQFPFQNILSWGSSSTLFKFNLLDFDSQGTRKTDVVIILSTTEGRDIEDKTMSTVRKLMADMKSKTVTDSEYLQLLSLILDEQRLHLHEGWLQVIAQFSVGRTFLAKQCVDLMLIIGPIAPFEKTDLAFLLYTRLLNKDSFQMVVNVFDSKEERENLLHSLGRGKGMESTKEKYSTDCQIVTKKQFQTTPHAPVSAHDSPPAKTSPRTDSSWSSISPSGSPEAGAKSSEELTFGES